MPFIKIPGFEGQIYIPDEVPAADKKLFSSGSNARVARAG